MPVNMVYAVDESHPVDAAVGAAAISRIGGLLLLTGGSAGRAESQLDRLGLSSQVDRIVVAESAKESNVPWALIAVSAALAIAGIFLLAGAMRRSGQGRGEPLHEPEVGTRQPARETRH
jgi:NADH:ubiquinone oxidoreductase subunit 5 (subunit L)/multisubunit Na+/H+ antiporter MnhA subunit